MLAFLSIVVNILYIELFESRIDELAKENISKGEILASAAMKRYYVLKQIDSDPSFESSVASIIGSSNRLIFFDERDVVFSDTARVLKNQTLSVDLLNEVKETYEPTYGYRLTESKQRYLYTVVPLVREHQYLGSAFIITGIDSLYTDVVQSIWNIVLTSIPFMFLLSIVFYLYASRALRPLEAISEGVNEMSRGNYSYRINSVGIPEVTRIGRAFNVMAQRLNEINQQQSQFVSNVSHELKTPVSSIRILLDSILSEEMDEELKREFLEDISNETDRLWMIIDDLLYIASIEKQDMDLTLELRPLSKAIEESIAAVSVLAHSKNISIEFDTSQKYFVEMDFAKMKQVFINIIGNAVKYTNEGGWVKIRQIELKNEIIIEIEDNGIGIEEKDLPYIFDRFFRVSSSRTRKTGGTGLGTNIAQQVMNLHHGKIGIQSEFGKGTTVSIVLPKKYEV